MMIHRLQRGHHNEVALSDYSQYSDEALLSALDIAGQAPEPTLIDEILARRDRLVAPLAALFSPALDDVWEDGDDPRWHHMINVGRILLYWREPSAIPTFAALYQQDDDAVDWFQDSIAIFGPAAIHPFREVLLSNTGNIWHYGKAFMADVLAYIALLLPETRSEVVSALHSALPTLREDGSVDYPTEQELDENWDSIVMTLAILQDESSRSLALALFDAEMLQEEIMTREDYLERMKEGSRIPSNITKYDLPAQVREDWEVKQSRQRRPAREAARPKARLTPSPDSRPKVGRNDPCPWEVQALLRQEVNMESNSV